MSRTVDYGIDLGTTTSLIAKFTSKGPVVVPSSNRSAVTPSVVAVNSQGQVMVGHSALRDPEWRPAAGFKRHMGTGVQLPLGVSGVGWSPVALSAEVLKELKAAVRRRFDDDIVDVVITVPAMFQQPQCEATREAAELAGLRVAALIQEPIAAAGAYLAGRANPAEGHYLVYDLGGGTFDVSVLRLRDGELTVRAHGGDNYLGGQDIDGLIKAWAVEELVRQGQLETLTPMQDWILGQEVEQAKIRLTDEHETALDLTGMGCGPTRLGLTRQFLEALLTPLLSRTVRLCEERLSGLGLSPKDVHEIFLVGGPTQMPLIRRQLKEHFGCELSLEMDPITAVVEGAALHAAGLLATSDPTVEINTSAVVLELHFDPVCNSLETSIAGKVLSPADFVGEVMLRTDQEDWETGWMPLRQAAFFADVSLKAGALNVFKILLRDAAGRLRETSPSEVAIKQGLASADPVAPYNYGVVLSSGRSAWMITENTALPAYKTQGYRSAVALEPGSTETLNIYLVEGHSNVAEDNVKVGELKVSGADLKYRLDVGDEVEIRLRMDQSRLLRAHAYFPVHDMELSMEFHSSIDAVAPEELKRTSEGLLELLSDTDSSADPVLVERLTAEAHELEQAISKLPSQPDGTGEVERLSKKLSDLRSEVRPISSQRHLDELLQETLNNLDLAIEASTVFGDERTASNCVRLKGEAEVLYHQGNSEALSNISDQAHSIFMEHYRKTPTFWIGFLDFLEDKVQLVSDREKFLALVEGGRSAYAGGDLQGLTKACIAAFDYLPKEAQAGSGPFARPGLQG